VINKITSDDKLNQGPLMICAKDEKKKQEWVDAILSFKHCKIDSKGNGKLLVEFKKVNELNQKGSALQKLYYDANDKAVKVTSHGRDVSSAVHQKIQEISKNMKMGDIAHDKVRRTLQTKLNQAKLVTVTALKKENLIKNVIDKKIRHEALKEEKIMKLEHKERELSILHKLNEDIIKIKKDEIKECKKSYATQIETEREKANKQGKTMIKMILEQNKLSDFSNCTNRKLSSFTNIGYVTFVCKDYFGLWGYRDCSVKANFCRMCCEHNIGVKHAKKRYSCKKKCNSIIRGDKKATGKKKKSVKKRK